MSLVVVSVFEGLALAGIYALIALGMVLVYRASATFNLAHGQMMLVAAYLVGDLEQRAPWPVAVDLLISLAVAGAVGGLIYVLGLQRMVGRPHWTGLVATLLLGNIINAVLALRYGSAEYTIRVPGLPGGSVGFLGGRIGSSSLAMTGVAFALALIILTALRFTRLGVHVRAAGQDAVLASQGGIHVRRLFLGSWLAAGVLAGVAGILYGSTSIVDGSLSDVALIAVPAMVLGGLDSFSGACLGALVVGLAEGFVTTYAGGQFADVTAYGGLLVILLIYPNGFFGTAEVSKV